MGKKKTVRTFRKMKMDGEKIVMLTAYDALTSAMAQAADIDLLLIGDSVGPTVMGYSDTVPVTVEDMIHHGKMVRRGAPDMFLVCDMPFLSYHCGDDDAIRNAGRCLRETGSDCVKLESSRSTVPLIRRMVDAGIPVMAHIGLLPQHVKTAGGYRVAGREADAAAELKQLALDLQDAGAFSIVLECVPAALAEEISKMLEIPTIGIGAGIGCDGQVQVVTDLLGIGTFVPKHAKQYAQIGKTINDAFTTYRSEVKNGTFPTSEQSF